MNRFKLILLGIVLGVTTGIAQSRGTPSQIRVNVDANGYLVVAGGVQTAPITNVQFNNARLAVDASGNLLIAGGGAGIGTVTSVGLSAPTAVFDVAGSPVTTSGTLALTFDTQTANLIFSGPASGGAATPTFRGLASADLISAIGADPNADRIVFWDDSAGAFTYLTPGTNLSITGTTLNAAGGSPGGSNTEIQFNNSGSFGGYSGLIWNGNSFKLTPPGTSIQVMKVGYGALRTEESPIVLEISDVTNSGELISAQVGLSGADIDEIFDVTYDDNVTRSGIMDLFSSRLTGTAQIHLTTGDSDSFILTGHGLAIGAASVTNNRELDVIGEGGFSGSLSASDFISTTTSPAVANVGANSCGTTAATITGTDNAFSFTVGATAGTACRVTFDTTAPNAWICSPQNRTTTTIAAFPHMSATTTTTADFVPGTAFVAGDVIDAVCFAR